MSFLKCFPTVFVVGDEYEISITTKENGLCFVQVGSENYYEENTGVLSTEKSYFKICVPQNVLNAEKQYTIVFRKTVERKAYFSEIEKAQKQSFAFQPIEKNDDIRLYHIADVHYRFDEAVALADFWGEQTDLFIVNGDIGEVETRENYFEVCQFTGDISRGKIPVLFVRGNHDTRGKLAELYAEYFPVQNGKTYFSFSVGPIVGLALDCGEDKIDAHTAYGGNPETGELGVNIFRRYREEETRFLKNTTLDGKIKLAVSHICPAHTTKQKGGLFDIDRDIYEKWSEELERNGVKLMICGHMHKAYIVAPNDEISTVKHSYYAVIASMHTDDELWGGAIRFNGKNAEIFFTDKNHTVRGEYLLEDVL